MFHRSPKGRRPAPRRILQRDLRQYEADAALLLAEVRDHPAYRAALVLADRLLCIKAVDGYDVENRVAHRMATLRTAGYTAEDLLLTFTLLACFVEEHPGAFQTPAHQLYSLARFAFAPLKLGNQMKKNSGVRPMRQPRGDVGRSRFVLGVKPARFMGRLVLADLWPTACGLARKLLKDRERREALRRQALGVFAME